MIYFDINATAMPNMQAFKIAYDQCYPHPYNASSIHKFGRNAKFIIENSRENILRILGFDSKEYNLVFCASATEANNLLCHNIDNNHTAIISAIEHLSIINKLAYHHNTRIIPTDFSGIIDLEKLELELSNNQNCIISIIGANNETGILQPLSEIKLLAQKYKALFHSDIVQIAGKISLNTLPDICTISAHKFGGPQGIGALIYRKDIILSPLILGGGQEKGIRSGTENIFSIAFMNAALEQSYDLFDAQKCQEMRNYLEQKILHISNNNAIIVGKYFPRLPNTSCIIMPNVLNSLQLATFDLNDIAISAGSACSSGKLTTSYVLKAMGFSEEMAQCAIRVSISGYNSYTEIDQFLSVWKNLFLKSQQRKAS